MNATEGTLRRLSDRQMQELRRRHPHQIDFPRDAETVRERGWVDTNVAYLEGEKSRSAAAMRDLMREVGVERVRSREEALDRGGSRLRGVRAGGRVHGRHQTAA